MDENKIKNIVLHFPWGAGGNFIRNCLLLDDRYEFDHQQNTIEERYNFLVKFYQASVTQENWLDNEWKGPRSFLYTQYYETPVTKILDWHPHSNVIYISHGQDNEIQSIIDNIELDLNHVFLIPSNKKFITEVYVSKSPKQDGHLRGTAPERLTNVELYIKTLDEAHANLQTQLIDQDKPVYNYDVNHLFNDTGYQLVLQIAQDLSVTIPEDLVKQLHNIWLTQTKKLYNTFLLDNPEINLTKIEWTKNK